MSDDIRQPRRKEKRLHANQPGPRPARRSDECTPRIKDEAGTRPEESLRQAEQKFQAIFDNTSDGIFLLDLETRKFTMGNQSCLQMLGYTPEEFVHLSVADLHHPADLPFIYAQIEEFLTGGQPIRHDIRFRRKDGSILFVDLSPSLVVLDGRRYILAALKNITERKRMEEELRQYAEHLEELVVARTQEVQESEQRYRSLAENAPDIIQRLDRELRRLYVNPAFEQATGLSPQAVVGKTDREVGWPEDLIPCWEQAAQTVFRTGERQILVFEMPTPEGPRYYEAHLVPEFAPDGSAEHLLTITRDITERKRAEDALRASEERFRTMADEAPIMIGVTNEKGEITFLNQAWLDFRGKTLEEEAGWNWAEGVHPEDRDRVVSVMQSAIERGDHYSLEYRIRDRLGNYRWVLDTAAPLRGPGGESRGYIGTAMDITERKRAEEAVAESRRRYRGLVERINDWAWEVDADCVYTYASPRARELLGYAPEEIVGKTPFDLMPPAEAQRVWDAFRPTWLERKPLELLENTLVRKDGRLVTVETSGMPVFAEDGTFLGYTGIDRDVTERKRAEEALREKEYLLSESQRIGHIGTWSADPATGIGTWTPEMYRLFGVSPDTFAPTADAMIDLLHPDDRGAMREWIRAALAGEHPKALEFRVVLPDGSLRTLSGRGERIFAADTQSVRLVGTGQDVTERKQAEEALRQLSRRNEEALRVARMGHWEFDLATGMFTFNDQYYTLHGTTAQEAGGYQMTAEEFARRYVHPDDAHLVQQTIQEAARAQDPDFQFQTEARILRADGEARWVTVWFRIEHDMQRKTAKLYGVNQDVTERRQAQEALCRLNEHLELQVTERTEELGHTVDRLRQLTLELSQAEDRERQRIADILHDDVQQTLAAAKFHLNLLSSEPRSAGESREIVEQVKHMLKDAIEKSRHLSHELSPALYQVELIEILKWLARHMEQKHGLTVRVEAHGHVDSSSEPLKALLYKVVQELLFNVVKHAEVSEAGIRVRRLGRNICLSVVDRGRGFNPHELERTAGFGLLSIQERVQLLGGRMKIRSTPHRGSRILIVVPDETAARVIVPAAHRDGREQPQPPAQGRRAEPP